MMKLKSTRQIAFEILRLVAGGGYASDLLLEKARELSPRDAGLASQLVFGCLRYQGQLDFLIEHYSGRRVEDLDESVRILLRLGIFQLRYLDRVPAHAAVDETVELTKRYRRSASGLTNAVLRKVRRTPVRWPSRAVELSCPAWLLERWSRHFGEKAAADIASSALKEPERYVRVAPGEVPAPQLKLAGTEIPGCFQVIEGATRGLRLHDIGAQSIVPLLELQPGHTFLDLCAAPGNKTAQALETRVSAVACDISLRRLEQVPAICPLVVLDAGEPLPFRRGFDRILIDAPCSGTGTLARNPEIKWRVQSEDFARLGALQLRILTRGLAQLSQGGTLVYATCSLEEEENEQVIRKALSDQPTARLVREQWRLPGLKPGDGFYAAVITSSGKG